MGPALRRGPPAAARLRRPGARPLLRQGGAVLVAVRAGQHDRGHADHPGQLLPPAALAGPVRPAQAADRVHPQVHAAAEGGRLGGQRLHDRVVPAADRRPFRRGRRRCPPGGAVRGQGVLRPGRTAARAEVGRGRHRPGRAAVPAAGLRALRRAGPLPARRVGDLGAGGAGQHGCLADHGAEAAAGAEPCGRRGVSAASSAPAAGSAAAHATTHREIIETAIPSGA